MIGWFNSLWGIRRNLRHREPQTMTANRECAFDICRLISAEGAKVQLLEFFRIEVGRHLFEGSIRGPCCCPSHKRRHWAGPPKPATNSCTKAGSDGDVWRDIENLARQHEPHARQPFLPAPKCASRSRKRIRRGAVPLQPSAQQTGVTICP